MAGIGQKKVAPQVPETSIPEVVEFISAKDTLEAFKDSHVEVFEEWAGLVEKYNTAMQNADKAVRAREVTCGPWVCAHFTTKYDAETLYNHLGRDKFLEVGGRIEAKTVYEVDKGRIEASIAQGKIANDTVDSIRKISPTYHAPKPAAIP